MIFAAIVEILTPGSHLREIQYSTSAFIAIKCPSTNSCYHRWAPTGVSNPEMRIFAQGQGNQALVRRRSLLRRTSKGAD